VNPSRKSYQSGGARVFRQSIGNGHIFVLPGDWYFNWLRFLLVKLRQIRVALPEHIPGRLIVAEKRIQRMFSQEK
jgi:hypothetical protein